MNTAAATIDALQHFALVEGPRSNTVHVLIDSGPLEMTYCGRNKPQRGWFNVWNPDPHRVCERCLRSVAVWHARAATGVAEAWQGWLATPPIRAGKSETR